MKVLMCLVLIILFIYETLFNLLMLQQNSYNNHKLYFKFILHYFLVNNVFILFPILFGIFSIIIVPEYRVNRLLFVLFIFIHIIIGIVKFYKYNVKLPLKLTKRLFRIIMLDLILVCLINYFLFTYYPNYVYGSDLILIYTNPFILILCVFLLTPVEKIIFNSYKKIALNKLNRMPNINIIGITGSYGKTSSKMILNTILEEKYKGFYTPGSFNTPNGIVLTINKQSSIFNDYFICEMGAKSVGQIKELCDIIHPKYGILTSIGNAHIETFKSIKNVCKTKFELIESLPKDGVGILNKDDDNQKEYKLKNKCNIIWVGIKNKADVMAKNIDINEDGMSFDIVFKDRSFKVNTKLLGNKNIYNILQACALASYLGVSDKEIIHGIKCITPVEHRLELKNIGNIRLIDDAFNSNPEGAKMALEVLSKLKGKKIIITPGMIEMGKEDESIHLEFGKEIADVCDEVYLIGKNKTKDIYKGLINKKFNEKNIFIYNTFKEAYNDVIKKYGNDKINVLIENDLPDSFMEG